MAGRRYPTQEERDERMSLEGDPEDVLRALLEAHVTVEPDEDADHSR